MTLLLSRELQLPLDAVTQKLAILGRTGSGKTFCAMKLAELMLTERAQVIAIDPVGVWNGLRLGAHPFAIPIFGGLRADVPLEPTAGALVADVVVGRRTSAVLDVSQMVGTEPAKFLTAFAERFFERQKAEPRAVHVFIEECQEVIPQNTTRGYGEEHMLHQFHRLIKIGRNFGIGVSMISQRPQEVNKKALNQTECLFAFQMTGPHERKTIEAWVRDKDDGTVGRIDVGDLLPTLRVGEAHVWSPQWLRFRGVVRILPKKTADVSQTPKVGAAARAVELSEIDIGDIARDMSELVAKAAEDDPGALHAEIKALKKELEKARKASGQVGLEQVGQREGQKGKKAKNGAASGVASGATEIVQAPAFASAATQKRVGEFFDLLGEQVQREFGNVAQAVNHVRAEVLAAISGGEAPPRNPELARTALRKRVQQKLAESHPGRNFGIGVSLISQLPKVERLILTALAQHGDLGAEPLAREALALFIGYHARSKGFSNGLSSLRSRGAIEELSITDAGRRELGKYEKLPRGRDLLEWYRANKLRAPEDRIVRALLAGSLMRDTLAERAEYHPRSKGFSNGLSRLRTLGIVRGRQEIRLVEEFRA